MQITNFDPGTFDIKYVPNLPPAPKRELGLIGRLVQDIRARAAKGTVQKIAVYALAAFVSVAIMLIPIANLFFVPTLLEFFMQRQRNEDDARFNNLRQIAYEHSKGKFLEGRWAPLTGIDFTLNHSTRQKMIDFLEIRHDKNTVNLLDVDLIQLVAEKDPNFLRTYQMINTTF